MRAGSLAAIIAASVLGSGAAWASCAPAHSRSSCIDFSAVPQISQQIVAAEPAGPVDKPAPIADTKTPYTGPTLGIVPNERRAPEIGYRWAIN